MTTPNGWEKIEADDKPTTGYFWIYTLNAYKQRTEEEPILAWRDADGLYQVIGLDLEFQSENVEVLKPIKPYKD